MSKCNLTISGKVVTVEYLKDDGTTASGTEVIVFTRLRDEGDGWWFDRYKDYQHNRKILFSNIVKLNGSDIGTTTQPQVTALLRAAL